MQRRGFFPTPFSLNIAPESRIYSLLVAEDGGCTNLRRARSYDQSADIWSFGMMMIELATGKLPLNEKTSIRKLAYAIMHDEPPSLDDGVEHAYSDVRPPFEAAPAHTQRGPSVLSRQNLVPIAAALASVLEPCLINS